MHTLISQIPIVRWSTGPQEWVPIGQMWLGVNTAGSLLRSIFLYASWNMEKLAIPLPWSTSILQLNLWETRVWPSLPKSCLSLQLMPQALCACLDTYQHLSLLSTHPRPPKDAEMSLLRLGRYCPLPEALLKWIGSWALHILPGSNWKWGQGRSLMTFVHKSLISVSSLKKGVGPAHDSGALRPSSLQRVLVSIAFILHKTVISGNWDQNPHFHIPLEGPNGFLPAVWLGFVFAQSQQHSALLPWKLCLSWCLRPLHSNGRIEFSLSEDN